MALHSTHKSTRQGRAMTLTRRAARAAKRSTGTLDIDALSRELNSGLADIDRLTAKYGEAR